MFLFILKINISLLFLPLFCYVTSTQNDIIKKGTIEKRVNKLHDRAFKVLQKDKYYEAFKLLDSAKKIIKTTDYYELKSRNYTMYGLAYFQVNDFKNVELYYKKAIEVSKRISDSIKKIDRGLTAKLNLQQLYALTKDYNSYYINYDEVRNLCYKNKHIDAYQFYDYDTEIIVLEQLNKYKEIYQLCLKALGEINNDEFNDYFNLSDVQKKDKLRLETNFELYLAYASMEIGQNINQGFNVLNKYEKLDLKNILWYEARLFKNIANIRYYKSFYYNKYNIKEDSALYYLKQYQDYASITFDFLEEKEHKSSLFLVDNVKNITELEKANLLLKNEKDKSYRIKITLGLIGLLAIILGIMLYMVSKDIAYKSRINKVLKTQYLELYNTSKKRKELEEKIEDMQNEFGKDLHDNFGNRIIAIESTYDILKELSSNEVFDKKLFERFTTSLKQSLINLTSDFKDLLWANNSENNYLFKIVNRILIIAEKIEITNNVNINIEKKITKNLKTPKYWNRQLILIIKEALNNALKHSNTRKIDLTINCDLDGNFLFRCQDYGLGFNVDELKRVSGIHNMRVRTNSIGCELTIDSQENKGTLIQLKGHIPIL